MPKQITGKSHVGERREKRPNGDVYVYERITAYNEKTRKTYTVSQTLKGKIKAGGMLQFPVDSFIETYVNKDKLTSAFRGLILRCCFFPK